MNLYRGLCDVLRDRLALVFRIGNHLRCSKSRESNDRRAIFSAERDETWDEIFNLNVRAPIRIARAVLAKLVKACRDRIINIGSPWSTRASVFSQDGDGVDYCSSKVALHALEAF
jgi:NAD(P)-dependent dehydrogenase (short-subunit alcohol dehydrogenase family)